MNDKLELDIPVLLPDLPDAADAAWTVSYQPCQSAKVSSGRM